VRLLKKVTTFVLCILLAGTAFCLSACTDEKTDSKITAEQFQQRLGITAEQAAQVSQIYEEGSTKVKAMMEEARKSGERPNMQDMRTKMETIKKASEEKLSRILSAEQLAEYNKMVDEKMKENRPKRGGKGPGGPGGSGGPPPDGGGF
jgi:Spy/CpxP family protein refolding chaperone